MTGTRLAALLRGINVGGNHPLSMRDLRAALGEAGCTDVVTYIQSGNVVFTPPPRLRIDPATWLTDVVSAAAGFDVPVVVRTAAELERIVAENPYPVTDPKLVHAAFFREPERAAAYVDIDLEAFEPEHLTVAGGTVYLWLPRGAGRSPMVTALDRRTRRQRLDPGTIRNWNTVIKVHELLSA
jgi:uncharacterized protein (DUF1697 family)